MMKHVNKYLSLALALVLCLSLAACGESNEDYRDRFHSCDSACGMARRIYAEYHSRNRLSSRGCAGSLARDSPPERRTEGIRG